MEAKIISIEEANRMLPLMRGIVADIMSKWKAIIEKRAELECLEKSSRAVSYTHLTLPTKA